MHYKDTVKGDAVTVANWLLNNYASHWLPQWLITSTGKSDTIITNKNVNIIKDSISKRIASLEEA